MELISTSSGFRLRHLWGVASCCFLYIALTSRLWGADVPQTGVDITSWDHLTRDGWIIKDRSRQAYDGTVEVNAGIVRLIDSTDHQPDFTELALPTKIVLPDRFAIQFRCRLIRLGLTDQGTGHKSMFRLLLGAVTENGPFSVNMNLTHDRYNLEANTKVYRTDDAWHVWRMEVDTRNHWVRLFRDGIYVGLHEAQSKQAEGLRLQVQGSSEAPAEVEIAEFSIQKLSAPEQSEVVTSQLQKASTKIRPGDWPVWRRDAGNTGVSPLTGELTAAPEIRWSIPVGSAPVNPYWFDLDRDDTVEGLVNHRGTLSAYKLNGELLWKQGLENTSVFGLHDLDDDGKDELIVAAGVPPLVHLLDAQTGEIRYRCPELPLSPVSSVRVAKLNPDLRGLQAVVWSPQHEVGYCLSFAKGIETAQVEWHFDWKHRFFHPTTAIADMNGDGLLDLVVVTYSHAFVFDGRSGTKLMEVEWNAGRNYGSLVVRDLDADGYPDVVVLAGQLREHISVLHNEGGKLLKLLWDKFYEQNYPEDFVTLRTLTRAVGDFDNDGKTEIAYSVWDERIDRHWRTLIVDAVTGTQLAELQDAYLVGIADIEGTELTTWLISQPEDRTNLKLDQLIAWQYSKGQWQKHSTLPPGRILFSEQFEDTDLTAWSQERHLAHGAASNPWRQFLRNLPPGHAKKEGIFLQPFGADRVDFICYQPDHGWKAEFQLTVPDGAAGQIKDVIPLSKRDDSPHVVVTDKNGAVCLFDAKGHQSGSFAPNAGATTVPVAAKLKPREATSILFFTPEGDLVCYRAESANSQPVRIWTRPASGIWSLYTPMSQPQGIPFIADVTPDEGLETLIAEKPDRLIALNSSGDVCRSWTFPALPQQWQVADFDGDAHPDLLVTYPTGAIIDVDTVAIRGRDGSTIWKMHCGNGPSAIADVNSDGIEDVVMRDLFERRILDGRTGLDLQPIEMTAGYHTPLLSFDSSDHYAGVLWGGGTYSIGFNDKLGQSIWKHWYAPHATPSLARRLSDGRTLVGSVTAGQIYQLPELKPLESPDKELLAHDLENGELKWRTPLGATSVGIVTADIDGDGEPDYLLATADGRLLAVSTSDNPSQRIKWQVKLPGSPGVPIVCDDGIDNSLQILISCSDGRLHCLTKAKNQSAEPSKFDQTK